MSPEGAIAGGGAEGYVGLWGGLLIKRLESVLQSIESFLEAGDAGVAVRDARHQLVFSQRRSRFAIKLRHTIRL